LFLVKVQDTVSYSVDFKILFFQINLWIEFFWFLCATKKRVKEKEFIFSRFSRNFFFSLVLYARDMSEKKALLKKNSVLSSDDCKFSSKMIEIVPKNMIHDCLTQGSQTQIHTRATFCQKISSRATLRGKLSSRAKRGCKKCFNTTKTVVSAIIW